MNYRFLLLFICVQFNIESDGAKILGFFPVPSISHQVVFQPIWKELSLRGHEITVITPNPLNDPKLVNLTEIDVSFAYDVFLKCDLIKNMRKDNYLYQNILLGFEAIEVSLVAELEHSEVKSLIEDDKHHFDLVIVEIHNAIALAFGHRFKAPVVGVSSLAVVLHTHDAMGNPTHPVLNPDLFLEISENPTFADRLSISLYNIWYRLLYHGYILPRSDRLARKYFGNDIPYLGELEKNVSLLLINVNPVMNPIRANVPSVVEISQMHIKLKQKLPEDIQNYLDSSKEGVIYFSLGSNVKSANLDLHTREIIIQALSELPYKVLWKWETDSLPGKPDNVMIKKWLPQQDVLGHPNIKAFVTQCGIQSLEEAISNGVPLIAMPFNGDQSPNAAKMVEKGIAKLVDHTTMTKDDLKNAILEVADNTIYGEKVKKLQKILIDQPIIGVQKAAWWIEYVLRHDGAYHLRSPAIDMPWIEYVLLDVIAFILAIVAIVSYLFFKLCSLVFGRRNKSTSKLKKQ